MLLTEPPSIAAGDDTVLQPGMVISTEPGVRSGDVQFLWEDVHIITEGGHEQITLETSDLREIPFSALGPIFQQRHISTSPAVFSVLWRPGSTARHPGPYADTIQLATALNKGLMRHG